MRALDASKRDDRLKILISLEDKQLAVVSGQDTVMTAPVAIGSDHDGLVLEAELSKELGDLHAAAVGDHRHSLRSDRDGGLCPVASASPGAPGEGGYPRATGPGSATFNWGRAFGLPEIEAAP